MAVRISKSVGDSGAVNRSADVRKIQELLNRVHATPELRITGTCNGDTIRAIRNFQRLWPGRPDGRVDPGGRTLGRLNRVSRPLPLKAISLQSIARGGFRIRYGGKRPPAPYRVLLTVSKNLTSVDRTGRPLSPEDARNSLEVTTRNPGRLIAADDLPDLLAIVERLGLWGKKAQCILLVTRDGQVASQSAVSLLSCPTQPLAGPLRPAIGKAAGGSPLKYTGLTSGRVLRPAAINGKYFFAHRGKFETSDSMRGFNCITYVGAVFGTDVQTGAMGSYGTQLVNHLGGVACGMECKKGDEIKTWFQTHMSGTFFMWSENHIVLVVNGKVHEFTNRGSIDGYAVTDIQSYPFSSKPYWVRRAPRDF